MTDIPCRVQVFLSTYIRSADQLEVLLLLQATPHRDWSVSELSWLLSLEPACVSAQLHPLVANAIVAAAEEQKGWRYRFEPPNSEIAEAIGMLAKIYSQHKRRVNALIAHTRRKPDCRHQRCKGPGSRDLNIPQALHRVTISYP